MAQNFKAYHVEKTEDGVNAGIQTMNTEQLLTGDVLINVHYSSLNYKDALSATAQPGVTKEYPHTPGVDAAGVVVESQDSRFNAGDEVIVTSYDLGMNTWGGFGQMIRVPADWVVTKPAGLSLKESMMLGTAGLTAAMCIDSLLQQGLSPEDGPILVTGSTGGVGSAAVAILAHLGFSVTASTGKESATDMLKSIGATEVIDRNTLSEEDKRPMSKTLWAGAVDTVGGTTLDNIIKTLKPCASVACCGLVAGPKLNLTVFPFILRGVNLLGADSQNMPMARRQRLWDTLAADWKVDLSSINQEITLDGLSDVLASILKGGMQGHVVVNLKDS